jgi:transcriptional regulator of acetoin/glycerol metabolism
VSHPWPYNIRELEKGIALALTFAEDGLIELGSFPLETRDAERSAGGSQSPEDVARRRELLELMDRYQGNISQIARSMGKARMQIHRWLKQYGLEERLARARRAKSGAAAPGPTDELL